MFPYTGKTPFPGQSDSDPNVVALMAGQSAIEDIVLGIVNVDPNLKVLHHFDGTLAASIGGAATGTGAIRFWPGKYSSGVLVEGSTTNLVTNPSAEVDASGWSVGDASMTVTRDTAHAYTGNATASTASFQLTGTGAAGACSMTASMPVSTGTDYAASVWVYAPPSSAAKAKLEVVFSGSAPSTSSTGSVSLAPGTWTRLRLENLTSGTNTLATVNIYLSQRAPGLAPGSRLSTLAPTGTAPVTDTAMTINAGDLVMCATSASPAAPSYSLHMATAAATGVSSSALRLDDAGSAPTFVTGTRLSRLAPAPGDSVPVTDTALALSPGDLVVCRLQNGAYAWHLVTTGATGASSGALRLDDSPSAPAYASGSRSSRIVPSGTAPVTDTSLVLGPGDLVFARVLSNPGATSGNPVYGWHLVTTGATGVSNPALRLDNAGAAPVFAFGSTLSLLTPGASGTDADTSATLGTGDLAFARPLQNPAAGEYGWHLITTGATGVSNSALRLDQASSDVIWVDCVQLEASRAATSYCDSYQGTGYGGSVGSPTTRVASALAVPLGGLALSPSSTIAFWMFPLWNAADGREHVIFDAAVGDELNRLRLVKDVSNNLVFSVYDGTGGLRELTSNAPLGFARETWQHVGVTLGGGGLSLFLNGSSLPCTPSGPGSGTLGATPSQLFLGSDYRGVGTKTGIVFDELVVSVAAMPGDFFARVAGDSGPYLGVAAARKGFDIGQGTATTHATPGTQTFVPHGLGVTPAFVHITERGNGLVYLSAPSDAAGFYVTASASAIMFDWRAFA